MNVLTLITHASCREELSDLLNGLPEIDSFIVTTVEGHGDELEEKRGVTTADLVVGFVQKIRIEILLEPKNIDKVLERVKNTPSTNGKSIYWISKPDVAGTF